MHLYFQMISTTKLWRLKKFLVRTPRTLIQKAKMLIQTLFFLLLLDFFKNWWKTLLFLDEIRGSYVGLWNANRCQVSFTICLFSREVNREKLDSQPHLIICNVGIEVLNRIVKVQTTECCKKSSSSLSKDLLWPPILFNFCE